MQPNKTLIPIHAFLVVLLVLAIALTACSSQEDRLWLDAPGWSRAQLIHNTSLNTASGIVLDARGDITFLSTHKSANQHYLGLFTLNRKGVLLWEFTFDKPLEDFTAAQLHWFGGKLTLIWQDNQQLYLAYLNSSGDLLEPPRQISGEIATGSFDTAADPQGSLVVWIGGTRKTPGIYRLPLEDLPGNPILVDENGIQPSAQYGMDGTLHTAWVSYLQNSGELQLYYAAYANGIYQPDQQQSVRTISIRQDSLLQGPWISPDPERVYLIWLESIRSGRQMHQGSAQVLSFPSGNPQEASEPVALQVPKTTEGLSYKPRPGSSLAAGQWVGLDAEKYPLVSPVKIATSSVTGKDSILALSIRLPAPRNIEVSQIGTILLQHGVVAGYQLLSLSNRSSLSPAPARDANGNQYITWLESAPGAGYGIYFASTAPDIIQAFGGLTPGDISWMVTNTFFGLLHGIVFFPFVALIWLVLPAILLGLTWIFRRGTENLLCWASLISLVLAMGGYWISKMTTFSRAVSFVPFSPWVPIIPTWMAVPIKVGVPILGTVFALSAAWRYARQSITQSALMFMLIYIGIDSLITMAIYGEVLFNSR